ncbi:MAG: hypothetical protein ACYCS7_07910 [Acidimicrobiales bacterium]
MRTTAGALGGIRVLDLMGGIVGPLATLPGHVVLLADEQGPVWPRLGRQVLGSTSFDATEVAGLLGGGSAYEPGPDYAWPT